MSVSNPQRIYKKSQKSTPGFSYWGNFGEIEIGLSSGRVESNENNELDKLHYHQQGVVFFLIQEGKGIIEVNGERFTLEKDDVLRISPGEKYRFLRALETPFSWITICTTKDPEDKVVI